MRQRVKGVSEPGLNFETRRESSFRFRDFGIRQRVTAVFASLQLVSFEKEGRGFRVRRSGKLRCCWG
jgi:hypothetical protein